MYVERVPSSSPPSSYVWRYCMLIKTLPWVVRDIWSAALHYSIFHPFIYCSGDIRITAYVHTTRAICRRRGGKEGTISKPSPKRWVGGCLEAKNWPNNPSDEWCRYPLSPDAFYYSILSLTCKPSSSSPEPSSWSSLLLIPHFKNCFRWYYYYDNTHECLFATCLHFTCTYTKPLWGETTTLLPAPMALPPTPCQQRAVSL